MTVKGLLNICKGIFSPNVLTFEDSEVSPAVSLLDLVNAGDNNIDGGFANAVYLPDQCFDGGGA